MRALLVSSLVCSALVFGCGDDKGDTTNSTNQNPTQTPSQADDDDGDTSAGMSETGKPTTDGPSDTTNTVPPETSDTTNGSASTDPATSGDPGTTFIVMGDGGGPGTECDNWAQDCPEGQKCSAYAFGGGSSWDSLKCVPVMEDPAQPGDECIVEGNGVSGIDNCDLGSYCWDTNAENVGACVALCKGSPEAASCDDATKTCAIYNEGVLNLCLDSCDPLSQDCAMADDVCIGNPSGDGFLCVLDASGEEGQQHDPCEYANSCDPGMICLNSTAANECDPNSSGCCQPFCEYNSENPDMTDHSQCTGMGQECNPYYEAGTAPPGQENIGYCAIPA